MNKNMFVNILKYISHKAY